MDIPSIVQEIYEELRDIQTGKVADYIPQLADVNPDLFGISVTTADGQSISYGDAKGEFCLQSCCKPLNYCLSRTLLSSDTIHSHVGYEPSGQSFNSFVLNRNGLPHNPMINAGAIMVSSLIEPTLEPSKRFDTIKKFYTLLCGGVDRIGFDNNVFLSERHHADRNTSLAYYMRENRAFDGDPSPQQIMDTLELYFQCCSITINCKIGSVIAGTLAKSGICPVTHKRVLTKDIVQDCLSLMYASGMYDYSGQFSFQIGLPAKSGVSGCLFLVVPNCAGICIWSPRLDEMGNSVRGVAFCQKFVEKTQRRYHIFNTMVNCELDSTAISKDPVVLTQRFITAAATGNLSAIKEMNVKMNVSDYDGRTALHLAAAEGHYSIVEWLLEQGHQYDMKDRWGNTPYHEAQKMIQEDKQDCPYAKIVQLLEKQCVDNINIGI